MTINLDALTLPEDLLWKDEFDWSPVVQSLDFTLTGALLIQEGVRQAGRPITLQGGYDYALATRAVVAALKAMLNPSVVMTLTLNDGRSFSVRFRHGEKPIEAEALVDYSLPDDADLYRLTLRLMQV